MLARVWSISTAKNEIHRDTKPDNILNRGGLPVLANLSKFLEEEYDTSLLTSDVCTRASKAPEFWERNADGKLNHHGNLDIYAMGLTFLAIDDPGEFGFCSL